MVNEIENPGTGLEVDRRKTLALWEIASVITSALIAEWVVLAFVGSSKVIMAIPLVLAVGLMITSHREHGESLRDLGFRADNFLAACRLLLPPTVVAVGAIVLMAWWMNQALPRDLFRVRFILLPLWALVQQYALNGFINRRAQMALGSGVKSVLLVGVAFSLLHLPNPQLALLTLAGGLIWGWAYQRQPNLLALALSHTVVSITLALTISPSLLNSLRVGFKYFG